MKIPKALHEICAAIHEEGGRPLIVGGAARDAVMGMKPKDFDVEVFGIRVPDLLVILERFGKVNAVGVSFGIIKLTVAGDEFDFSVPRRDSKAHEGHRGFIVTTDETMTPFEAAQRRDFTMNTLAFDPITGEFVDTHGAIADIKAKILRPTSEAFVEDPLRVLRGMQFAARFDLKLHDPMGLFKKAAVEFGTIAKDRIRIEFEKLLLKGKKPSAGFQVLIDAGVISLFPRIAALIGIEQDEEWHPEGNVFSHTMFTLDAGARQCDRDGIEGEERIVLLLADLCHDFGKVERTIFKDGRWRAPAHEAAGEQPTIDFLRSIGFGERIIEQVVPLVTSHMQHIGFGDGDPRRFVRRLATRVDITRMAHVVEADHSGRPPLAAHMPEQMVQILKVKAEMDAEGDTVKPILMGRHLIEMGMKPSRRFSEILAAAHEAQIEGVFSDVAGAMEFVRPMVAV